MDISYGFFVLIPTKRHSASATISNGQKTTGTKALMSTMILQVINPEKQSDCKGNYRALGGLARE